jgi:transposase
LWAKEFNAKDILKEAFPVYGGKCLSRKAAHNWVEKFSQGHSKVADDIRSGRPVEMTTEATVQRVEELVRADRRITIDSVATALGRSHGLVYSIMHDRLKFRKVCARWVSTELNDRQKMNRMGLSLQHFLRHADGEDMLNRIVIEDKSWVHHYQPESKRASVQWAHPSSFSTRKYKVTPSDGQVMLTVIWNSQGVLLAHF